MLDMVQNSSYHAPGIVSVQKILLTKVLRDLGKGMEFYDVWDQPKWVLCNLNFLNFNESLIGVGWVSDGRPGVKSM